MNKTTIIIIIVAAVVVIALLYMTTSSAPATNNDLAQLSAILTDPANPRKDCRQICSTICKKYPLFGGRTKCVNQCKSDCAYGKDVTKINY